MGSLREVDTSGVTEAVRDLCIQANCELGEDILGALKKAPSDEESELGRSVLGRLVENAEIAREERMPMCQDTGMAVVFMELGQDVHLVGGALEDAVNEGVRRGYREGYLRKSVVSDPLLRQNTGDNTPCVLHLEMVPGDRVKIAVSPKGFGSENMSALKMLKPADGLEGVKSFVVEVADKAGANPCPPIILGVGIGGTFEKAALLAKKALLRPITQRNPRQDLKELELELLDRVNRLGIGPQGFGGRVTALAVNVETYPTHIAGLPVAVNVSCHATRHAETVI